MSNITLKPELLHKLIAYMKFVSRWKIIFGILGCLSILGAILGVPQLISGLRLKDAADRLTEYTYDSNTQLLEQALEAQQKYLYHQRLIIIITLLLMFIGVGISIIAFIINLNSRMQY